MPAIYLNVSIMHEADFDNQLRGKVMIVVCFFKFCQKIINFLE